eukprot:6212092-Pleurochrysis_carterae.AAC.3
MIPHAKCDGCLRTACALSEEDSAASALDLSYIQIQKLICTLARQAAHKLLPMLWGSQASLAKQQNIHTIKFMSCRFRFKRLVVENALYDTLGVDARGCRVTPLLPTGSKFMSCKRRMIWANKLIQLIWRRKEAELVKR